MGKTFGELAKRYALQIALEIIKGKKSEFSFTNEHMQRGHKQEPIARTLYELERDIDVTHGGFFDLGDYTIVRRPCRKQWRDRNKIRYCCCAF